MKSPRHNDVLALYRPGITVSAIARLLKMPTHSVSKILNKEGLRPIGKKAVIDPERDAAIARAYSGGMSPKEIAQRFGVSSAWVATIVRRAGGTVRSVGGPVTPTDPVLAGVAIELWNKGRSLYRISKELKLSEWRVRAVLTEHGLKIVPRPMSGPNHTSWAGGRALGHGYVYIQVADDDPHADMRDKRGYVSEHRLLMARKLGRSLREDETVHHKDDVGTNNHPDNLQLRIGKHGKGAAFKCATCGSHDIVPVDLG